MLPLRGRRGETRAMMLGRISEFGRLPLSDEIRPIEPEELEAFTAAMGTAFGFDVGPEILEQWRGVGELDRSLAVFDGTEIVGTAGIFSYTLTVSGAGL